MLKISVHNDSLRFGEHMAITFQRTLRIPDDGKNYPLPPGLGAFPIRRVKDYQERVPADWRERGGYFIPMYQREALWLSFGGSYWRPSALKIGIGKINAISGEGWDEELHADPQNYVVCPNQPWLDGINAGDGFIRQFVAMPLGRGYTVEAQLTGKEDIGGIQIIAFEPKPGRFPDQPPPHVYSNTGILSAPGAAPMTPMPMQDGAVPGAETAMGLGAGGKMVQKVYPDSYGLDTWDRDNYGTAFVHIVNSEQYAEITGETVPPTPVNAQLYTQYGFPWFELYDEDKKDIEPGGKLSGVKSIKEKDDETREPPRPEDESVEVQKGQLKKLWDKVVGNSSEGSGEE